MGIGQVSKGFYKMYDFFLFIGGKLKRKFLDDAYVFCLKTMVGDPAEICRRKIRM